MSTTRKKQLRRVSGAEVLLMSAMILIPLKQLRRVSGAEEWDQHKHHADWMKQLRRVSGVNNYHKILTIII